MDVTPNEASSLDQIYRFKSFNFQLNVCSWGNIYYIFGQVQKLTLVVVNFSVMFTDFGHIHKVILIGSSE